MARTYWKLHLNCSNEGAARKVFNQTIKMLGRPPLEVDLQPYDKGGFMGFFQLSHASTYSHAELVVEAIHFGQKLGSGWFISGDVHEETSSVLSCDTGSRSVVAGLDWAEWQLLKNQLGEQGGAGNR